MSTMSLRLPESLHRRAKELAAEEGISINRLVATALAGKISALAASEYCKTAPPAAPAANSTTYKVKKALSHKTALGPTPETLRPKSSLARWKTS